MRVVKRRHKKATAPVGRRKPGRVQDDAGPADGFSERILAALREFSPGVAKAREIHLEMSAPKDFKRLQKELKVLLSTGRVRREGKASGTKWGLPTSTAAAKDDADAPTRIQEHDIRRAVLELLSSGASYDLTAIHRNASRQFTSLTLRALTPIVEALRKENKIELIPGLTGPGSERYCKRAA
jgi:hypothetical protein